MHVSQEWWDVVLLLFLMKIGNDSEELQEEISMKGYGNDI
jgi:hypothetical protein